MWIQPMYPLLKTRGWHPITCNFNLLPCEYKSDDCFVSTYLLSHESFSGGRNRWLVLLDCLLWFSLLVVHRIRYRLDFRPIASSLWNCTPCQPEARYDLIKEKIACCGAPKMRAQTTAMFGTISAACLIKCSLRLPQPLTSKRKRGYYSVLMSLELQ